MVRAIHAGTKTQTRRVVKPQPPYEGIRLNGPERYHPIVVKNDLQEPGEPVFGIYDDEGEYGCVCPYGQPGDRLWVRETWNTSNQWQSMRPRDLPEGAPIFYAADYGPQGLLACKPWNPSIFLPRWASRLTLEIVAVRVERLQDISEADAAAEGVNWRDCPLYQTPSQMERMHRGQGCSQSIDYIGGYRKLWESINGPGSWEENPWVWVVEFKRI